MEETLKAQNDPEGVGLAAPQIGKSLALFLMDYKDMHRVIINPEIVTISHNPNHSTKKKRKKSSEILEGCLSLPHFYGPITRANRVTLKYKNLDGQEITEEFKGFLAQIVQHEVDHLQGVLFVDHILEQKAPLYKFSGGDDWEEVKLT
jgi:peptide deformylase